MVVLGGVTRLTRSGLSIVVWEPIIGAIPPLTDVQWQEAFANYRQTPEYREVNTGMTLAGFKSIYWVEYAHRLLGRLIGLVFLIPFLYFLLRRKLRRGLAPKLTALFLFGALQGALGWYMVASGLVDLPRVSPYRLTVHLGLAVLIYAYMFWVALGLIHPRVAPRASSLTLFSAAIIVLVFAMILSGGFVAGTRAGFTFNTFPLMNGQVMPAGMFEFDPWWRDMFENVASVQFYHRALAYLLTLFVAGFWWWARKFSLPPRAQRARKLLLAALVLQVTLGIATLLWVVPIPLAAAHQGGALLLLTAAVFMYHALRTESQPSLGA